MINNITLEVGLSDYNNAKAEFLSEYFLEQVESGQMTFFQALLQQKKVRKAADRAREDNQKGLCIDANDEAFFDRLKSQTSRES